MHGIGQNISIAILHVATKNVALSHCCQEQSAFGCRPSQMGHEKVERCAHVQEHELSYCHGNVRTQVPLLQGLSRQLVESTFLSAACPHVLQ